MSVGPGPVRAATEQGRADTVDGRGPGLFADSNEGGSQRSSADHNRVLVRAATRVWTDRSDDDLRSMIPLEEEALAAWMMGAIMLQSPPGFLVCTHPRATRVAMLDFFKSTWKGRSLRLSLRTCACLSTSLNKLGYSSSWNAVRGRRSPMS